jgi:hypothetical protein
MMKDMVVVNKSIADLSCLDGNIKKINNNNWRLRES